MNSAKMMDDSNRAEEIRHASHMKMTETGEVERLKDLLRTRLVECGWKDKMKVVCKEKIREKGVENITVEELVTEITPIGRKEIPDSVKKELLQKITKFFEGR